ncbi:hypothetical protein [Metallosphaera javensis (ex Sakai et al. 2022)]|uniref:hypothetical protein n=1 Tax=Metallosphaera javensis (ex Sakai et al. 2022) TaxID=2775498 RepID=UPI00258913FF|nr:MAG: hypothetical protein MjAS7_1874 [Metallosphaera javensis (ex Sakai et al. 2022)]
MPTEIMIREGDCSIRLDCSVFLSFENDNVVRAPIPHPEGICVRQNEIVYIELKAMGNLKGQAMDSIVKKIGNLFIHKSQRNLDILDEKYRKVGDFIAELITQRDFRIGVYIVIPSQTRALLFREKDQIRKMKSLAKGKIDLLCILVCGTTVTGGNGPGREDCYKP